MRPRKIPLRKCVACQKMIPKKELIRVVKTPQDEIHIDLSGKKAGRGAYLCGRMTCFTLAKKSRALDRALKYQVNPTIYDQLAEDFISVEDEYIATRDDGLNEE